MAVQQIFLVVSYKIIPDGIDCSKGFRCERSIMEFRCREFKLKKSTERKVGNRMVARIPLQVYLILVDTIHTSCV